MSQLEKKQQEIDWQHRSTVNRIKSEIWSDRVSFLQKVLSLAQEEEESGDVDTTSATKAIDAATEKVDELDQQIKADKEISVRSPTAATSAAAKDEVEEATTEEGGDEEDEKLTDDIIDQDFEGDDKELGVHDLRDPDWAKQSVKDARYRGLTDQEWATRSKD